jgi:DNA primase
MNRTDFVAEVKARTNGRALAEELGLPWRWKNFRCPFHDDHNPSMSVWADGFKCWACGAKGDVLALYRGVRGVGFRDALEYLAARCGVTLPPRRGGRGRRGPRPAAQPARAVPARQQAAGPAIDPERRSSIYTALVTGARLRPDDPHHGPAIAYLRGRGISAETAIRAGLGYLPPYETASAALRESVPLAELQAAKLFNDKGNLRLFKHRLVIPYSIDGEVVTIQARNLSWKTKDDGPKELTFGLVTIPLNADVLLEPQQTVYVCEGGIDTLSLLELGLVAVGIPGAKSFRPEWCELFADVADVVLALDNDKAGHEGAAVIAGHFGRIGREVRRLELPEGVKDVNEFLQAVAV